MNAGHRNLPSRVRPTANLAAMSFLLLMTMLTPLFILAGVFLEMSRCPNGDDDGGKCLD